MNIKTNIKQCSMRLCRRYVDTLVAGHPQNCTLFVTGLLTGDVVGERLEEYFIEKRIQESDGSRLEYGNDAASPTSPSGSISLTTSSSGCSCMSCPPLLHLPPLALHPHRTNSARWQG